MCSQVSQTCTEGVWPGCSLSEIPGYESPEMTCDDLDNNCDGKIDEGCDDDGDSWCDMGMEVVGRPFSCLNGSGDCDDNNETFHPKAEEKCDGIDSNCNGIPDHEERNHDGSILCSCNFIKDTLSTHTVSIGSAGSFGRASVGEVTSFSGSGDAIRFNWDFGDGGTSTEEYPSHI